MIKRIYITVVVLCSIGFVGYGQNIILIDNFNPYERIGDTLYYNRNNYAFVASNIQNEYGLITDINLFQFHPLSDLKNKSGISPYTITFKNKKPRADADFYSDLCLTYRWGNSTKAKVKDFKIRKNNVAYYIQEKGMLFPEMPNDTSAPQVYIPIEEFPDLRLVLKEFYQYLNFENLQEYSLTFEWDGSMKTSVEVPNLCNPEIHGTGPRYSALELKHILDSMLVNFKWPTLKAGNHILPYITARYSVERMDYVAVQLEKKKGNKDLQPLFSNSDSVLTIADSANFITTIFIPGKQIAKDPLAYSATPKGFIDANRPLVDVNNDGTGDYIIDTTENGSYNGSTFHLQYIPFYRHASEYGYYVYETLAFTKYLGNHYYYYAKNESEASIFFVKDNQLVTMLSISKDYWDKKGKPHYKEFTHSVVYKNPELTLTYPSSSLKAYSLHNTLEEKIKYYVKNPEQLLIDFPMN